MYRKLNYKLLPNSAVALGTVEQGMWGGSDGSEDDGTDI